VNMPGFVAEASLRKTGAQYGIASAQDAIGSRIMVLPQASACQQDYDDCKSRCAGAQACLDNCSTAYNLCVTGPVVPFAPDRLLSR
jgi:hypothetical protein